MYEGVSYIWSHYSVKKNIKRTSLGQFIDPLYSKNVIFFSLWWIDGSEGDQNTRVLKIMTFHFDFLET